MRPVVLAALLGLCFPAMGSAAGCFDHQIWDGLLKTNVDTDGFVNYDAIRVNKGGDLYEYVAFLEDADLSKCTDAEKLAFWINGYNAHMVRLVLARPRMAMVSEDFKLFGEKFTIANRDLTLNEIEHRVLRSSAKNGGAIAGLSLPALEPRIHFALVCGAIDCPKLLNRAYRPEVLEDQLQSAAVQFANNPKHLRIENGKVVLSTIMKWYGDDFKAAGGVPAYLVALTDPAKRPDEKEIDARLTQDFPSNVDFRYDWTLNSVRNKPKP